MKRITRAIRAITVWYYRTLDFVQRNWTRFRKTEVGEAIIWLVPRALKGFWWLLKIEFALIVAMFGAMFVLLLVLTGNGKTAIKSMEKVALVSIGFVTAKKLVEHKAEVAATIAKAIGTGP